MEASDGHCFLQGGEPNNQLKVDENCKSGRVIHRGEHRRTLTREI